MTTTDEIEELSTNNICSSCVDEAFLKATIDEDGYKQKCSYCGEDTWCFSIEDISNCIETAFEQHYYRTSDQPNSYQYTMLSDKESDYEWERDGAGILYVIMDATGIGESAASDILEILSERHCSYDHSDAFDETEFSPDSHYEERGTNDARWQAEWSKFERSLKTETRFFSQSAALLMGEVFSGIESMKTQDGSPLIVNGGPDTSYQTLHRARSFQQEERLLDTLTRPDKHLGPPPSADARAGRMNAHGISVFYGTNHPIQDLAAEAALAEVRPPVGSRVAIARFNIIRPVRLLDLTALNKIKTSGSIFDPQHTLRLEQAMFLRNLSSRITIPVMPDHETLDYLATQAIADFLATESNLKLDGIIFPSVQSTEDALNVVLFHKASRVEDIDLPKGTSISAESGWMSEDGWELDYSVVEETPPEIVEDTHQGIMRFQSSLDSADLDTRAPTLRINLESVAVHSVNSVKFSTTNYSVSRHRWEKRSFDF